MNLKLKPFGRLGNNIIQIINVIHIAIHYKYNIILKNFKYINTDYIVINPNVTKEDPCITDGNNFYYYRKINNIDTQLFNENRKETIQLLKKVFYLPKNFLELGLTDDDLVIHIRSGDIFNEKPHPDYVPSPLSYFNEIICSRVWAKIYIISQDKNNPVIDHLLKQHTNIIYKKNSLEQDISIILEARNIVMDVGTFIPSLLLLSESIKILYYNRPFFKTEYYYKYKLIFIDYREYISVQYPWVKSPQQLKYLIEYQK